MQMLRHIFGVCWHTRFELNFWCILARWFVFHVGCGRRFASSCCEHSHMYVLCKFNHCLTQVLYNFCLLLPQVFAGIRACVSSNQLLHSFAASILTMCHLPDLQALLGFCYGHYELIHLFCCTWPWVKICDVSRILLHLHVTVSKGTWCYLRHFMHMIVSI